MKTKKTLLAAVLSAGLFNVTSAHAALELTLGGAGVYDTDLNITWLRDANLAATETFGVSGISTNGSMRWDTAQSWIAGMKSANYLGYSDWRLPTTIDLGPIGTSGSWADGSIYKGTSDSGWNVTSSEMGHLYYTELGNLGFRSTTGVAPQPGQGLTNVGPFSNIQSYAYWSDEYAFDTAGAWGFIMDGGSQGAYVKDLNFFNTWAVRDGNSVSQGTHGNTASDPIMPVVEDPTFGNVFTLDVLSGRTFFIDPLVAIGYDYTLYSGPNFQSVLLPNIGDGLFDLYLWDPSRGEYVFSQLLDYGIAYDFGVGGVDRFRIMGIEASAGLDPNNPNAFVTGLTFAGSGTVDMSMTPYTFDTGAITSPVPTSPVPEPETYAMLLAGLGLLSFTARRRKQNA